MLVGRNRHEWKEERAVRFIVWLLHERLFFVGTSDVFEEKPSEHQMTWCKSSLALTALLHQDRRTLGLR